MASTGTKNEAEEPFPTSHPDGTDSQPSDSTSIDGGAATGAPDSGEPEIQFNLEETFTRDPELRIFGATPPGEGDDSRRFRWTADESLTFDKAALLANNDGGLNFGKDSEVGEDLLSEMDSTGITLDIASFVDNDENLARYLSTGDDVSFLTIRVDWVKNKDQGRSFSPYFAIVNQSAILNDLGQLSGIIGQLNDSETPEGWQVDLPDGEDGEDGGDGGGGGAAEPEPSASAGPDSGGTQEVDDESDGGGGGGLSTGAIAGIAVGGAVVLIALAVIFWFVLRRRRRSKAKGRAELAHSPNPSNHYIGSKEATDGELNSPYSEDGANVTQHTPLDPSAPRAGTTESPASFTPYQDVGGSRSNLERTGTNNSINTHSNSPVESGSRGLPERSNTAMSTNQNVAHLVEDGMTEDDIRRLEEEERQLDFEIERAGRR